MEQSSVASSLLDPATSLPESQDICRDTTGGRMEQSSVASSRSDPATSLPESQDTCRDTTGGRMEQSSVASSLLTQPPRTRITRYM